MGATLVSIDGVGVGVHRFLVGGGPLHSHFKAHHAVGIFGFKRDDFVVNDGELL